VNPTRRLPRLATSFGSATQHADIRTSAGSAASAARKVKRVHLPRRFRRPFKSYSPVTANGTIGPSVVDISTIQKDLGVFTYDPGFGMTAATESRITYIDGDAGVLHVPRLPHRAARREELLHGVRVPAAAGRAADRKQLDEFTNNIRHHTMLNETLLRFFNGFHHNAHPDGDGVGGGGLDVGVLSRHDGHL
jgi:hypothetical protein